MMKKDRRITDRNIICLAVLTAVIVVSLIIVAVVRSRNAANDTDPPAEDQTEEPTQEPTEKPQQSTAWQWHKEEIVYSAPSYDFKTDEVFVEIEGLEREYTIAFVNDIHMITDHSSGDVTEDDLAVAKARYETLFVTEEGTHAEDLWPEVIKFLNYNDFDAVVFAGDILDYCSNSNMTALLSGMNELKYPNDKIMYIRSDHDYGGWYGGSGFTDSSGFSIQRLVLDGDVTEKVIEFDDFMIVGINRSYKNLSEEAFEIIDKNLGKGKPVLIVTHVPFYSEVDDSLEELSIEARGRIYYWSWDGTTYVPDTKTQALIDRMYAEDSNVVQILAAHVHAYWDGYVTDRLKEHIFAPSFEGRIGIIHVKGNVENER